MSKFYDAHPVIENEYPFCFIIGGRGIGKTYSSLFNILQTGKKFFYIRSKDIEIRACCRPEGNPFKKINSDFGYEIAIPKSGILKNFVDEKTKKVIGYGASLNTFGNICGADFSDIDIIIFDEFIARPGTQCNPAQGEQFLNLYETVNRNRELSGFLPVKALLLANSTQLASPILTAFDIVGIIEKMIKNYEVVHTNEARGIYIELPQMQEFAEEKKNTALYRATAGSRFSDMALKNDFAYDSFFNVRRRNLKEYYPICAIDEIFIYRHKTNGNFYACRSRGNCPEFTTCDSKSLFLRTFGESVREACISGTMEFSEFLIKTKLLELF